MDEAFKDVEPLVYESRIGIPYNWWAGDTATRFFNEIKEKRAFAATRCKDCGKVFVPPRKTCPTCFNSNIEWQSLPPEGELVAFTIARRQLASLGDRKAPVVFGLIRLTGADTSLTHIICGVDENELAPGLKLKAVFKDDPEGNILDVAHFTKA